MAAFAILKGTSINGHREGDHRLGDVPFIGPETVPPSSFAALRNMIGGPHGCSPHSIYRLGRRYSGHKEFWYDGSAGCVGADDVTSLRS